MQPIPAPFFLSYCNCNYMYTAVQFHNELGHFFLESWNFANILIATCMYTLGLWSMHSFSVSSRIKLWGGRSSVLGVGMWMCLAQPQGSRGVPPEKICKCTYALFPHLFSPSYFDLYLFGRSPHWMKPWMHKFSLLLRMKYPFTSPNNTLISSSEDRVRSGAKKLVRSKQGATQGRLDTFFKPVSSPAAKRKVHKTSSHLPLVNYSNGWWHCC